MSLRNTAMMLQTQLLGVDS